MQVELKITATTQKEAAILASTAGFLADVMGDGGEPKHRDPYKASAADPVPVKEKVSAAAEPKAKGPGRPKKEKAPEPEPAEDTDELDDLDGVDDEIDDDEVTVEDDELEDVPAPKKAKAEKAPSEKKYQQKDIINGFKDYANSKGRDAGVALLKKYNVKSSREIKESDYPAFMKILSK